MGFKDAFSVWNSRLAPAVLSLSDPVEQRKYSRYAKLLSACLLDSDEACFFFLLNRYFQYTKAIICLGHVVRLHDGDVYSSSLLTYWLCLLGYWSLAKTQVLHEEKMKQNVSIHKEIANEVINDIIYLHTEKTMVYCVHSDDTLSAQDHIIKTMQYFESVLAKSKTKTFQQYETQILIKRVLIAANHLSYVDLTMIGDPLQNMDFVKARYETLVKSRSSVYYGKNMKEEDAACAAFAGGGFEETKIDEYLKLSAALAEHFKAVLQLCFKYVELGILRESESEGLKLLHQVIKAANLQRCLAVLNVLFLTSTFARGNGVNVRPDRFRPLIVSLWNGSENEFSIYADKKRQNKKRNLSSKGQEIIDLTGNESNSLPQSNKGNMENKLTLDEHAEFCNCVICTLCRMNSQMHIEAIFSKMLFYRYSSKIFRMLSERWILKLPQETSLDVSAICSALQKEATDKATEERRFPLEALNRFLFAAIRWLRRVGEEERPEIVQGVIKESLKICSTDPVYFRWQWLTIRQLARTPVKIPELEWIRLHVKTGLRSPLKSIMTNLASELSTLTLCSPKPPAISKSEKYTPISKENHNAVTNTTSNYVNVEMEEARKDFDSFSHLLYREWRFQTCSYLGQICAFHYKADWIEPGWSAAYYFNEAMFMSIRQLARMITKKSEKSQNFHFKNIEKFKEVVQRLPPDLTVVQLFLDSKRILWLIKLYNDRSPLVVPVSFVPQDDVLLQRFSTLLMENDTSGHLSKTCTDPKEFWRIRRKLDKKLKNVVSDVQTGWFGIFSVLLLPSVNANDVHVSLIDELVRNGFSRSFASVWITGVFLTLVENLGLSTANWRELVQRFSCLENLDETIATYIADCRSRWMSKFGKQSFLRDFSNSYVLLCVSPELASFPFELLPVMESHKRICRISSLHMFEELLCLSEKIPKTVDGKNSFYVLDPGGDLTDTQKRLSKELEKYTCWKGTIGAAPNPEELRNSLETNDLFFYMGHGSGGKYFGRSTVLRSNIRAVSVLMGCASVRITCEGEGFDGKGAIYDYMIAKCPCVVGCLWMVTDGEIDRVLLAVLDFCFSEIQKSNGDELRPKQVFKYSSYRLLIDGIACARTACKLKYLTGGAVVAYGLPIVTHLSQDMIAMKQQSETTRLLDDDTALLPKSMELLTTQCISGEPSSC
uniref:separase n=1 Tax=Elaeophora elaphi TaxID=1147741 RepID=A0A0R3RY19_9BILA